MVQKFIDLELELCFFINKLCAYSLLRIFFSAISRLGNGIFWYFLMIALPVIYGYPAWKVTISMALTSLVGLVIYKIIKNITERPRPYSVNKQINLGTAPLDKYSFPSGHTLHAMSFSTIAIYHYPELAWLLVPFTFLVALSRVLLGLHYPTDVAAGAIIGSTIAALAINF